MTCEHDWNTTSSARLVIDNGSQAIAMLVPTPVKMLPVDYCRICGTIRLRTTWLDALRQREAEKGESA